MLVLFLLVGLTAGGAFSFLYHDPTVVTTQQDGPVGSLRWAVANAPSNSTITFATNLSGETIVLTGDLVIPGTKHLTLKYTGPGKLRISLARNTLRVDARASLTLFNLSLLGGTSNPDALLTNDGTLTLTESTVSGNTASGMLTNNPVYTASEFGGGGIYNDGTVSLTFCTLYGNQATDGGGLTTEDDTFGSSSIPGYSTIQNSLIAGNTAPQHPDIAGKLTSKGYNLIQNGAGTTFIPTTGDQFVSDLSRVFASNVHIENNGGPTQTLALLTDPANTARGAIPLASCQIKEIYDAHARIYIDQRGAVRPGKKKTACDIGAYETQM
jgi:hypothetical protein